MGEEKVICRMKADGWAGRTGEAAWEEVLSEEAIYWGNEPRKKCRKEGGRARRKGRC